MRILIVDDDTNVRTLLRAMLDGSGVEVAEARGGAEAAKVFRQWGADLILCDVFMPEGDGLDLLRELRRDCPGVKIIVMSGGGNFHGTIDILPMATFLGAAGVLYKPFGKAGVLAAIRSALASPIPSKGAGVG